MEKVIASDQVLIRHELSVSVEDLGALRDELGSLSGNIRLSAFTAGPRASLEWRLPTLVCVWIGSGVASGFFREIGASGARKLKDLLATLFKKLKEKKARWITPSSTRGKPVTPISFECTLVQGRADIRFMFPANLSESAFLEALEHTGQMYSEALAHVQTGNRGWTTYVYQPNVSAWIRPDLLTRSAPREKTRESKKGRGAGRTRKLRTR